MMWLQAMFGAVLSGGQTTAVEGADTFTPKIVTFLAGHVFWHSKTSRCLMSPFSSSRRANDMWG
ncbi:major facilitator superfamily MFS [Alicyclobacillus hesperidum URH17-3-68]|nr:major facilitator superfamily MFS [Alicyclobacillus hesperidum URH17-3-68]